MNPDPDRAAEQADDPRVALAAERTLLAWLRTGLAMMGFGFVVARFGLFLHEIAAARGSLAHPSHGLSLWVGATLIVLGVVVNVLAAVQHVRLLGRLKRGEPYRPSPWSLGVVVTAVLAALGVVMTIYLFRTSP
jgi:putative membrane protein